MEIVMLAIMVVVVVVVVVMIECNPPVNIADLSIQPPLVIHQLSLRAVATMLFIAIILLAQLSVHITA
jgi:hypothetical protein